MLQILIVFNTDMVMAAIVSLLQMTAAPEKSKFQLFRTSSPDEGEALMRCAKKLNVRKVYEETILKLNSWIDLGI